MKKIDRRKFITGAAQVVALGVLRPTLAQAENSQAKPNEPIIPTSVPIKEERWLLDNTAARRICCYEQPSEELLKKITPVHRLGDKDVVPAKTVPGLQGLDLVITEDSIPLYPYWQGNPGEYVFHPMAYGSFFSHLSCKVDPEPYLNALVSTAHKLPNGGLLWYYPDVFSLSRFIGPDISPSAIGQGRLLGGIVQYANRCNLDLQQLTRDIFKGLTFSYYDGGLNLNNAAQLEIPLFRSAPEVVLNGWIHALFFIKDYIEYSGDEEALVLLRSNYAFLAKSLPRYHDERTGLSKYSDLVPYRVRLEPGGDDYRVLYVPRASFRRNVKDSIVFKLEKYGSKSPYDNQIVKTNKVYTLAWVACSGLYDTYLFRESGPFTLSVKTGEFSHKRATPAGGGEKITIESRQMGPYHVAELSSRRDKLFCGFPTNFLKYGKYNYYHVYHVVSLLCLLAMGSNDDFNAAQRQEMKKWIKKWMQAVDEYTSRGMEFTPYEQLLEELKKHGACTLDVDWETLLQKVGIN